MIPYGRQDITEEDVAAVVEVLQSDWLTQGPTIARFEQAIAHHVGAEFGVAVNSATSALHIACLALDLGPGDWLWTTPNTFVASANCALYCGAKVDFVDIDPRTYNLSVEALNAKLIEAERQGTLPKVVIPVHFAGQSADMEAIHALSKRYGFSIIEDASHAIGGLYQDQAIGNCRYSDISIFSFHPVKIITTGEGGMAITNQSHLAERMFCLRSHGITRNKHQFNLEAPGPWYYEQIELGFNYRMTDIQAALGLKQLERLPLFIKRRRELAASYDVLLSKLPLLTPFQHPDTQSAYHLYVVQVKDEAPLNRDDLYSWLIKEGIGVNVHYIPVHTHPYYRAHGFAHSAFPEAETYYTKALTLPLFYGLKESEQRHIVDKLTKALG